MTSNAAPDPAQLAAYAATPRGNRAIRTWTIVELLPLFDPTIPVWTIAEQMGVPRATVTYELVRLRRAGFPVPRRTSGSVRAPRTLAIENDARAGMTDAEASRRHGVSPSRVWEMRRRAGMPVQPRGWTDEERDLVIAHQDRSAREMAALVGLSVRAVDGLRSQLIGEGRIRPKIVRPRRSNA